MYKRQRLQGAIEKFVNDTNAMADRMEKTVGAKDADILRGHIPVSYTHLQ